MTPTFPRPTIAFGSFILVAALLITLAAPVAAATGTLRGHFGGNAFAASATANAGQLAVRLGRAAYVPCACTGTRGKVVSNRVTDVRANDQATLEVTESKAFGAKSRSQTATTWTRSDIVGLDLLDGLITADVVRARANVHATRSNLRANSRGSRFVNLTIAGQSIAATVGPNRRIDLAGLGYVMLREVTRSGPSDQRKGIAVTMIRLVVTVGGNGFGLPIGAEVIIGRAWSLYDRAPIKVQLRGAAYATKAASEATIVKNRVGKAAFVAIGCQGSGGKVRTNTVDDFAAADVLHVGTGDSTVMGKIVGDRGVVRSTSRLQDVWLLDNDIPIIDKLIKVDLLKAVATATYDRSQRAGSASSAGSRLANISIANLVDIPITVPPNTTVQIPGVGRVILYRRSMSRNRTSTFVRVTMLVLVIESPILGIPVGTRIELANASAGVGRG